MVHRPLPLLPLGYEPFVINGTAERKGD
jgi:hypothetical protein